MLRLKINSTNNFLSEALNSYNIATFFVTSAGGDVKECEVDIEDFDTKIEVIFKNTKETFAKPIKLGNLITLLFKIYGDCKIPLLDLIFVPAEGKLYNEDGTHEELTEKETQILCSLYLANNLQLRQSELNTRVFGFNNETNSNALESHIYRLRQKILSLTPSAILNTIPGGYKLS